MVNIPLFTGFDTYQVVQDFFHQLYDFSVLDCDTLHGTNLMIVWSFWLEIPPSLLEMNFTQNSRDSPWVGWIFFRLIFAWFPSTLISLPFYHWKIIFHELISISMIPKWIFFSITSMFPPFYLSPPHNLRFPLPNDSRMVFVCPGSVGSWWRKPSRWCRKW